MSRPTATGRRFGRRPVDSVLARFRAHAAREPSRLAFTFLTDEGQEAGSLTFGELDTHLESLAAALRAQGLQPGDRALLLCPREQDFIVAFLGCLAAGVIAVPAYPVTSERGLSRLEAISRDCQPALVITSQVLLPRLAAAEAQVPELAALPRLRVEAVEAAAVDPSRRFHPRGEDLAFLQYTSGSTAKPKGVRVSHTNLLANEEMIRRAFGQSRDSVIVSWLPLFHDMGLIGGILQPLFVGARCVLMPPLAFLRQPARWLKAISHYQATTSGGPDFAYSLCARKVTAEEKAGLDLSSWRLAFNGAEPVRPATLERFAQAFAGNGFEPRAFYPCYGLAEATLFASGGRPGQGARLLDLDARALEDGEAKPARGGRPRRTLAGCGRPAPGQRLVIVDPQTAQPVAAGRVGEIWLAGDSVAQGYWRRTAETAATFEARLAGEDTSYLRTGDLGFQKAGTLFVTGRLKDLIIVRGRNLYPQDLEITAEHAHPGLRPGGAAAFAVEGEDEEKVVLVAELDRRLLGEQAAIVDRVCQAVAAQHDVALAEVVLIREQTLPKTSSGKVQRLATRRAWLEGRLERVAPSPAAPAPPLLSHAAPTPTPPEPTGPGLELELRRLLAEVLKRPPAELASDRPITALGVDSLAAAELAERLARQLGVGVELAELLAGPTLAELTTRLAASPRAAAPADEALPGEALPDSTGGPTFEAPPGQAALWFLEQLRPGNPAYIIARAATVAGPLDRPRLAAAMERLLARHAGLSLRFRAEGERVLATVGPPPPRSDWWEELDGSTWDEAELRSRLETRAFAPFDLEHGRLVRLLVVARTGGEPLLLLALHHLAADFRSLETLLAELATLYPSPEAPLPPPPTWPALAAASLARRHRARRGLLLAFWRQELAGLPEALDLPTDRARPALPSWRGASVSARFDAVTTSGLERLAKTAGTTLFAVVSTLYGSLLARLSGVTELALGVPTRLPGAGLPAALVGYWVNPIVLRLRFEPTATATMAVEATGATLRRALDHADAPFPWLVAELAPGRDLARSPLFQAMAHFEQASLNTSARGAAPALAAFAIEAPFDLNDPSLGLRLGELTLKPWPLERRGAQLDLTLAAAPLGDGLGLSVELPLDLFDPATLERWLGHLRTLTTAALARPDAPLAALPLLTDGERHELLAGWQGAALAAPPELLPDLVFTQAERTPDAPAVVARGRALTYRQLAAGARVIAQHLVERGVGPELGVAVALERTVELPMALLGVLAAGGFYVPLDPSYPEDRLAWLLADAEPVALIAAPAVLPRLPALLPPLLLLDGRELAPPRRVLRLAQPARPDNLAYLIYTSGSTGRPKAVAIRHQSAAARVFWALGAYGADELACTLASTSVCFDLSVFELFAPLAAGGTVVLADHALDTAAFADPSPRLINTVPSAMAALLRLAALPSTVTTVNLAGEALPRELVEGLYASGHVRRVVNLYGPSEDTTYSTGAEVPSAPGERVLIGRPLPGSRARLRGPSGELVPTGLPGELLLGGVGLARGYFARPGLTAARFVPDPWATTPGERLYRTGDLARSLPGGELELLGRFDQQVKVRGFRIELGEIEAVLVALPGVAEAVVVAERDVDGEMALLAYVAPAGSAPSPTELIRGLSERLPAFMVPARVLALDALPRNRNGKVDRRALPAPGAVTTPGAGEAYANPLETRIGARFAAALGLTRIDREANFFSHGGHSLKAAGLAAALATELGREVPVSLVFQAPTVAELARRLASTEPPPTPQLGTGDGIPRPEPVRGNTIAPTLPLPDQGRPPAGAELATAVAAVWAEVLGLPSVGLDDNFFTLGGHSLQAARAVARIQAKLGRELSVRTLLEAPTAAALAERLATAPVLAAVGLAPTSIPDLAPLDGDEVVLSSGQERLWYLEQLAPGLPIYNLSAALSLSGPLEVRALREAFRAVVARHLPLNTAILTGVDGALGRASTRAATCPVIDLTPLGGEEDERVATGLLRAEARRAFDLSRPPLARSLLLRQAPRQHLFCLSFHHAASDGWSLAVASTELAALYRAARHREPAPLPPLTASYGDFVLAERQLLASPRLRTELEICRQRLAGAPLLSTLPGDRPRPAVESHRGATFPFTWPASLRERVVRLARSHGTTAFTVVAAGLSALLHRATGADDLVLGVPVANRNQGSFEGLIGLFVNTVALRLMTTGDPSFATFLGEVHAAASAAHQQAEIPLNVVIDAVAPPRGLNASPLFQVVLAFTNTPPHLPVLDGLEVAEVELDTGTAKFDLTWMMSDDGERLRGSLEVATDLYDGATALRLISSLAVVLAGATGQPTLALSALPVLTASERAQIAIGNTTTVALPELGVHTLVRQLGETRPETVALVAGNTRLADARLGSEHLSYGELLARSSALASRLVAQGVGPEVRVGLLLGRSLELVVATLAVLEAGGAYLPLDPTYPAERLALLISDARPSTVIVDGDELARLPTLPAGVAVLRLEVSAGSAPATRPPVVPWLGPEQAAYVMYTSGSTGRPKGVVIPHRAIVRLVRPSGASPLLPPPVTLFISATAFDAATYEIWQALANGGRVVVAPPGPLELATLAALYRDHQVRESFLSAGLFHQLAEEAPTTFADLRELLAGGDVVSPAQVVRVLTACPGLALTNGYGPTENTTFSATFTARDPARVPAPFPLGRPIANTTAYVLGARLTPVPFGQAGELLLGGAGLARGYFARPRLSAERFVPDGESGAVGGRLYRSGDLVRYRADGQLEFLGRRDQQVKIRGFRIEPGEIEAVLAEHGAVEQAVVVAREGALGKTLVAYVRPRAGTAPSETALRTYLGERLPAVMVPAAFVTVTHWPLTPHGKVDRRRLPEPATGEPDGERFVAPATATEAELAALWAELLELPAVSTSEDFFALGGHSLLAMRLMAQLARRFAVELPLATLFAAPTVAALAREIDAARAAESSEPVSVQPATETPAELSFAQERLWFLDQLDPGNATYNVALELELLGVPQVAALAHALAMIVRRHPPLRARFPATAGRPRLEQAPPSRPLALVDLTGLPAVTGAAAVGRLAGREARLPFNLERGPVLRAVLLRAAPDSHRLLLTVHHIVTDGASMALLCSELEALYTAHTSGQEAVLPTLTVTASEVAAAERRALAGAALEPELAFWRHELDGLEPLELPTDHPRPRVSPSAGKVLPLSWPESVHQELEALGRDHRATLFMVLAATLGALLGRLTGSRDLALGVPVAGRRRAETEPLIGLFVNTVVLRLAPRTETPFSTFLATTRQAVHRALAHQQVPFERVVEAAAQHRELDRTPLFQVLLALTRAPLSTLRLPGLKTTVRGRDTGTAKFDLSFGLIEDGSRLHGGIELASELLDTTTVARWARAWEQLATNVARHPETRLGEVVLLSASERQQLAEWNDTGLDAAARGPAPRAETVHELVLRAARQNPAAIAAVFEDQHLSYGKLAAASGHLAAELLAHGVTAEQPVGIAAERSIELVVGLVAILRAGGAYLPLDPSYPAERLAFMLEDSGATVVLGERHTLSRLPASAARRVELAAVSFGRAETPGPAVSVDPDQLVSLIYTSGSTGQPKGVLNHHRGLVNRLEWMSRLFPDGAGERVIQKTPTSFDVSAWELFWPLSHGARLVLAHPQGHRDGGYIKELVSTAGITTVHFVASLLDTWLGEPGLEGLTTLRRVVSSGEAVSLATVERFHGRFGGRVELWDFYGPTEASIEVTAARCEIEPGASSVSIGRPIDGAQVQLLAGLGEAALFAAPGELAIGGVAVARGYHRRPGKTAERFVPDAANGKAGARVYLTGDVARQRPDGRLEYLGRRDHQIKIRGFRVELGEIESELRRHPEVAEAVVTLAPGERLAAYVTAANLGTPPEAARLADLSARLAAHLAARLADHLSARLPAHMVPQAFTVLPALPLSPSGKLDRRLLPAPLWGESGSAAAATAEAALTSPLAELVAGIWSDVLGVENVHAGDDFFARGGHSLLAARVVARVRETTGLAVPLRLLFEQPTLSAFVAALAGQGADSAAGPALKPRPREQPAPLSFAQERLWVLDRFEPGNVAFNMPGRLRLRGDLDLGAMSRALDQLLGRHAILRTALPSVGGRPLVRVEALSHLALPLCDLSGLGKAPSERQAERLAERESTRPFILARAPHLRALLLRRAAGEHELLLTLHHVAGDGWSLGVLAHELGLFYRPSGRQVAPSLAPLPLEYADYAAWQRQWLESGAAAQQLAYWRRTLEAAPNGLGLPTDRPRKPLRTFRGRSLGRRLDGGLRRGLEGLARGSGATLYMVLLAAFKLLLSRLSGETDLVVGTPVATRGRTELEGLVGIFLNTLVLRTDLGGDPSFRELLGRVRETTLGAFAHQELPFERLLDELQPQRDPARTPLFEVFFNLLSFPFETPNLEGLEVSLEVPPELTSKFDLTLYADARGAELELRLTYNADLFDETRIAALSDQLATLLAAVVAAPDAAISSFSLAGSPLLPDLRAPLDDSFHGTVEQLFARRAAATPEATALRWQGASLSYGQLAAEVEALAGKCRQLGIGAGDAVAIVAHRSPELVVAVLGVLTAGAAFVILDPAYPPARLAAMVARVAPQGVVDLAAAGSPPAALEAAWSHLPPERRLRLPTWDELGRKPTSPQPAPPPSTTDSPLGHRGPNDLAYYAFTSGSTGEPKGIVGRSGPLAHFLPWYRDTFGIGPGDRLAMLSGLGHDPLHRDLFLSLCLGATLCVPAADELLKPGWLARWMAAEEVTVANLTPAMGQLLADGAELAGLTLPHLRLALFVGDALGGRVVERLHRLAPALRVVNLYGATESQQALSFHPVERASTYPATMPLGRGLPGVQLLVLNGAGELAGIGELGEIRIRSPHLAAGYLGDPELTAQRFEINPKTRLPNDRLYRTGDLGRYGTDGAVVFASRADQQLKIRGFRVESGEIESELLRLPEVREAAVVTRGSGNSRHLAAFVVAATAAAPEARHLRQRLAERLPAYMLPSTFTVLERLPLNPNGKVDRLALGRLAETSDPEATMSNGPSDDNLERTLTTLLREILRLDAVPRDANFFELGGNSLTLVEFQGRLQALLGREIQPFEIFNHPTVSTLAAYLGKAGGNTVTAPRADRAAELEAGRARLKRRFAHGRTPPTPTVAAKSQRPGGPA